MNTVEKDTQNAPTLEAQAREFTRQSQAKMHAIDKVFVVLDLEYRWDREAHRLYQNIEAGGGENEIRWPFCSIVCASWLIIRFWALDNAPMVEQFTTLSRPDQTEAEIVYSLCEVMANNPSGTIVSWGGESKDFAAIRRAAAQHDIRLPMQLVDGHPHTARRIDLANATSCQTQSVHMPEYATATGIPSKLMMPSRCIGKAVEHEDWPLVQEVCDQDVVTTALLACRYLSTHGLISATGRDCDLAIADGVVEHRPDSIFVQKYLKPWLRARQ